MQCVKCGEVRLSNEFPSRSNNTCKHPSLWCLECVLSNAKNNGGNCPECLVKFTPLQIKALESSYMMVTQIDMFTLSLETNQSPVASSQQNFKNIKEEKGTITITLLTGENCTINYDPKETVEALRNHLAIVFNIPVCYQKIMLNNVELKVYEKGKAKTLEENNIKSGNILQCMRVMCAIEKGASLDKVVFQLVWNYPKEGMQYLDGGCLVYNQEQFLFAIDYFCKQAKDIGKYLCHSGDITDNIRGVGKHTINISLKKIPRNISHIFFVLSAYSSPTLAVFPDPSVVICEENQAKILCNYTIPNTVNTQAVIMCCLKRDTGGGWTTIALGKPTAGSARNYSQMQSSIGVLLRSGILS